MLPAARRAAVQQHRRHDDAGQAENTAQILLRKKYTLLFLIAQHQRVEACQQQAVRNRLLRHSAGMQAEKPLSLIFGYLHGKPGQPLFDLRLRGTEIIGCVPDGGRAIIREIPARLFQQCVLLLHRCECRTEAERLFLADRAAEKAALAELAYAAAPGMEYAALLRLRHSGSAAAVFQRLPCQRPLCERIDNQV